VAKPVVNRTTPAVMIIEFVRYVGNFEIVNRSTKCRGVTVDGTNNGFRVMNSPTGRTAEAAIQYSGNRMMIATTATAAYRRLRRTSRLVGYVRCRHPGIDPR
jgi:hypothetical protein